jgi:hypothetical protein
VFDTRDEDSVTLDRHVTATPRAEAAECPDFEAGRTRVTACTDTRQWSSVLAVVVG